MTETHVTASEAISRPLPGRARGMTGVQFANSIRFEKGEWAQEDMQHCKNLKWGIFSKSRDM